MNGEEGLDNWHRVADANWRAEDGAIVAYRGKDGSLVSKSSYKDFQLRPPDPADGTGAIVDLAKVSPMPKAGGKWNTLEITAKGF